ncbi:autotransporter outer membrane beta-barrel domain-containing protein [Novosphingobium sp. G106]|uniref:autotransporter outer membrane beta-barrel domain-containing protein n=1 Tax=Novosphingobium sp. G106 TaxID=2849500 RepID=UPI001C2DCA1C|nr:autotransporter outer membrane beta-barrel domain-containing protein [Novosphingobium sp. G106]MBV1688530.1 autotransporter outer membrane beta-barrel domain-containing protein [Novosphingobium sp. G106]
MTFRTFAAPASGVLPARARHLLGCAAVALAFGALAPSAFAATECGALVGITAACTGTNFPAGITYNAASDLTVSAPQGVSVNTTTAATNGISVSSTGASTLSGAAAVTTSGDGSNGVNVTSSGGPVSVNTGAVTTSGLNASGIVAVSAAGPATVNAGPVTVTGNGGNAIFAQGAGPVVVTSSGARAANSAAIVARSSAGTATVTNSGIVSSVSGDGIDIGSATGSTVNNSGTISAGSRAIISNGGAATINNTGTINGALALTGGGDVVNNSGQFNAAGTSTFGAADRFNNTGLVAVGTASTVPATVALNGLTSFNNAGSIDMRNGRVGDRLTVSGNYVGSGNAQLGVDIAPGATVSADRLVIAGSATGTTSVVVAVPAGVQPVFNTGTVIVQAGAGSSATAFVAAPGSASVGLVGFDVTYNPAAFSYSVTASPSDAAYDLLRYGTGERNLWYKSADAVTAHMQARRDSLWSLGDDAATGKFWVTMVGSIDHVRGSRNFGTTAQSRVTNTAYNQDYFGGQLGFDLSGGVGSRGGFALGVTGGYINSRMRLGGATDHIAFDAVNGGAYASFTSGNIFINALGKYDYYWANAQSLAAGFDQKLHGHSYGARGEAGVRLGSNSFFVEPLAQISYVRTSLSPFAVQGTSVSFDDRDGLRGKAGARIGGVTTIFDDTKLSFYAGASYVHDFKDESSVTFANAGGTFNVAGFRMPDYGEGVAGINIASNRTVSGFIEGTYTRTFHNGSGVADRLTGVGGRAGINVKL